MTDQVTRIRPPSLGSGAVRSGSPTDLDNQATLLVPPLSPRPCHSPFRVGHICKVGKYHFFLF